MVSGLKSEHVFKMAAHVSSTSSQAMPSSSEDSASEDPINIAKGPGADLKEADKAEIARTRKVQRNQAGGKKAVRRQKDPKVSARTLPNWSAVVRKLLLVQPSSASAERVFSLRNHFFIHLQENAREETSTVEASVMLCYNNN